MNYMFAYNDDFETLDISNFNTSKCTVFENLF